MKRLFKRGDIVRFCGAATYGIVIAHGDDGKPYVELMFEPGMWIAHHIANHDLVLAPEELIPDEVWARVATRKLLGLDMVLK